MNKGPIYKEIQDDAKEKWEFLVIYIFTPQEKITCKYQYIFARM